MLLDLFFLIEQMIIKVIGIRCVLSSQHIASYSSSRDIADICNSDGLKVQPTAVNQFLVVSRELQICDNMIHDILVAYTLAWWYVIIGEMDSTIDPLKELSDGEEPCCSAMRERSLHVHPD